MTDITVRKNRSKKKIINPEFPILVLSRSNANISAQVRDPKSGKTLFGTTTTNTDKGTKTEQAQAAGKALADAAKAKKIDRMIVDRNGLLYHGRVKAFVDGVRSGGITI